MDINEGSNERGDFMLIFYDNILSFSLMLISILITLYAQIRLKGAYKQYSKKRISRNLTGFKAARQMLDENGLKNIKIVECKGNLTDHYDPTKKVVSLSNSIYHGDSIASIAVACHEVGHAIQDKEAYGFMRFRSMILPVANIGSKLGWISIMIGLIFTPYINLLWIGIYLLFGIVIFQLVTLPVEFNASKRAKLYVEQANIVDDSELFGVNKMLNAAAFTYLAALLVTILQILRIVMIATGRSRD